MPKVAVVILNWNGLHHLKRFLPGVVKHSSSANHMVIVADNGSEDESIAFCKTILPANQIIQLDQNYGYALGYHKALSQIQADYFVLLNSDVEVTPNWIAPIIDEMESNHNVGASMPKIKSLENRGYFEYAGACGGFIDKYGYPFCRGRMLQAVEKDDDQYNESIPIFWASGACMFVRAKAYFEVEGLDGDFFAHMEEIDLCWRMKKYGFDIYIYPEVEVFHLGGGTLPNNSARKIYLNFRNSLYMLYKNLAPNKLYRRLFARMVLDGFAAGVFLLQFKWNFFLAVLKAHMHFYKHLPILKLKRQTINRKVKNNEMLELYKKNLLVSYFFRKARKFNLLKF